MAFSERDPLFGSLGLCSKRNDMEMSLTYAIFNDNNGESSNAHTDTNCSNSNSSETKRYSYEMLEDDIDRLQLLRNDIREEERNGETECLVCAYGDPHGSTEQYQQVLDFYEDNKNKMEKEALYRNASELYRLKVYEPQKRRRGGTCDLPLLQPRHFRRHEERDGGCGGNVYKMAELLAARMYKRLSYKLDRGVRKDGTSGAEEIDTADTHRAFQDFLNCARFSVSAGSSGSGGGNTTINVSSSSSGGKRGNRTGVSVSALVGMQKEKRQKRLDSLALSKYS